MENKNGRIGCAQDELWKLPDASSKATSSMARGFRGPNMTSCASLLTDASGRESDEVGIPQNAVIEAVHDQQN